MFEWDRHNLRKVRAHRITREEAEQALRNDPIPVHEQDVHDEPRFVYYGETHAGRLLAVIVTERGSNIRVVTAYDLEARLSRAAGERSVNQVNEKKTQAPKFNNENEEADWWASPTGRTYVKRKSTEAKLEGTKVEGSSRVAALNRKSSVQIAIRLPEADLAQARKIADRKGMGYQTLLKMLVREGLAREARRG